MTETSFFVHLAAFENHVMSKETEKVRNHNSNHCPHSILHTDIQFFTIHYDKEEKLISPKLFFNQPFHDSHI